MNIQIIKLLKLVLWIGLLLTAVNVQAAQVQGQMNFRGLNYKVIGGKNFAKSTGIEFSKSRVLVAGKTGHYRSVPSALSMKLGKVTYDPFPPVPRKPLWTFTAKGKTYSFNLISLTVKKRTATELVINARGTLRVTGKGIVFDPTPGEWTFRANRFGNSSTFKATGKATKAPVAAPVIDAREATNAPVAAPEIDAGSGTSAIALLAGALFLAAERSRRTVGCAC
jgi:hypothetical protein